jgi:Cu/Ag efflux pump CusA
MREKALEIDNMLFGIQGVLDNIADAIYNQNAIRSRELKEQVFHIGMVRENLKRMVAPAAPAVDAGKALEGVKRYDIVGNSLSDSSLGVLVYWMDVLHALSKKEGV